MAAPENPTFRLCSMAEYSVQNASTARRQELSASPAAAGLAQRYTPCVEAKGYSVDRATSYLRTALLVRAGSRVRTANAAGDPWAG
jgi:hypothetical protein